jgi:hypothetical protein
MARRGRASGAAAACAASSPAVTSICRFEDRRAAGRELAVSLELALRLAECGTSAAERSRERRAGSERRSRVLAGSHVSPAVAALRADRGRHRHCSPRQMPCGARMRASQGVGPPVPAGGAQEQAPVRGVLPRACAAIPARPAPCTRARGEGLAGVAHGARRAAVALTRRAAGCGERHRQGHPDDRPDHERKHDSKLRPGQADQRPWDATSRARATTQSPTVTLTRRSSLLSVDPQRSRSSSSNA